MQEQLLPGERVLEVQAAELLLGIDVVEPAAGPAISGALGSTAQALAAAIGGRAIGGTLHLTNYRFHFVAHGANWTEGSYSIFLPTIASDKETDGLLSDQLTVLSQWASHAFVVKNAQAFADTMHDAVKAAPSRAELGKLVEAELEKVGTGLAAIWPGSSPASAMLEVIAQSVEAKESDALQALAVLTALELFH